MSATFVYINREHITLNCNVSSIRNALYLVNALDNHVGAYDDS